jgi:hypothetical protein
MLCSFIYPSTILRAGLLATLAAAAGCSSPSSPAVLPDLTQVMRPVLSSAEQERAIKDLAAKKESEQPQPANSSPGR